MYGRFTRCAEVLVRTIRTAFIPRDSCRFIVSDFSAIEARVIAWLAGEQWRMEVFKNGGDIYCASASQMFHVPVVKHGQNGHLRQKGKIAELALGYGGSVGALKAMGALEMGLSEAELLPLVKYARIQSEHRTALVGCGRGGDGSCHLKSTAEAHGIQFQYKSGMLFITFPSAAAFLCKAAHW